MTHPPALLSISHLMRQSGVGFGTSGARGMASAMSDAVCYAYTAAFLQTLAASGKLSSGMAVAIAGDFRPSSPRIMAACALAVRTAGCTPIHCGFIPTPALALFAMQRRIPGIMVTGSHIPDDRNGIKFYMASGEILKEDEQAIANASVSMPDSFDAAGMSIAPQPLPPVDATAGHLYLRRYLDLLPSDALAGLRIAVYQHSSVARDLLIEIFAALGAEVVPLGRSPGFIPVDTEAVRPEDVQLARQWAAEVGFDAIVSADGDGDRPLVGDERGNWLRGDVAGILCARQLGARSVATPVSSNSAVEKCGWFAQVTRTRIGSPFVIAAMDSALATGTAGVVGYEANGGFLIGSAIPLGTGMLSPLPTRDAVIVPLALLLLAKSLQLPLSRLGALLPPRFTASDRLKEFPTEQSRQRIAALRNGEEVARIFEPHFGELAASDETDGLRLTFANAEVVHLRPSGNAPELRCYVEAASEARAAEMLAICLPIVSAWR